MLRKVNAQGLLDLIRANEEAPGFNLRRWVADACGEHPCGTYGCLAGNWAIRKGRITGAGACWADFDGNTMSYVSLARQFNLTVAESQFLFSDRNFRRTVRGQVPDLADKSAPIMYGEARTPDDRHAAINRVRKFLYYKLRKWELLYEEDGRVRESTRRAEGDHHVCRMVLASAVPVSVALEPAEGGG